MFLGLRVILGRLELEDMGDVPSGACPGEGGEASGWFPFAGIFG